MSLEEIRKKNNRPTIKCEVCNEEMPFHSAYINFKHDLNVIGHKGCVFGLSEEKAQEIKDRLGE